MNLSEIANATKTKVEFPNGEAFVRGLSLHDITGLVARNRAAAEGAFTAMNDDPEGAEQTALSEKLLAGKFLDTMPTLAAEVIAIALDEPDNVDAARSLPAGLQLLFLEAIIKQTAAVEGGLGKVIEIVIGAVAGTQSVTRSLSALPR